MPKKRPAAAGPTMFGEAGAENGTGAYPVRSHAMAVTTEGAARLAEDLGEPVIVVPDNLTSEMWSRAAAVVGPPEPPPAVRGQLRAIAAEVVNEFRTADAARIAELEDAIRRAVGFHRREMFETAKAVLEGVVTLEPTP